MADDLAVDLGQQPVIAADRPGRSGPPGTTRDPGRGRRGAASDKPLHDRLRYPGRTRPSPGRSAGGSRARGLSSDSAILGVRRTGREPSAECQGSLFEGHGTMLRFHCTCSLPAPPLCRRKSRYFLPDTPARSGPPMPGNTGLSRSIPSVPPPASAAGDRREAIRPGRQTGCRRSRRTCSKPAARNGAPTRSRGSERSGWIAVAARMVCRRIASSAPHPLNPRLHGLVMTPDGHRPSDPLATRRDGPGDGRALGINEITKLVGIGFVQMAVGIEGQVAELAIDGRQIVRSRRVRSGRPRRRVSDRVRKPGGSKPKKRRAISSPSSSYFAPPIPWMNRSPRKKPGEHRGRQGPGAQPDRPRGQVAEPLDRATGLAVGRQREASEDLVLAGDPQVHGPATLARQQGPAPRLRRPARPRTAPPANHPARVRAATGWCRLRMWWAARYSARQALWTS